MPTGRERPGEHWNARIIREEAEAKAAVPPPVKCHRCGYELAADNIYTRLDGTTYHLRDCPDFEWAL